MKVVQSSVAMVDNCISVDMIVWTLWISDTNDRVNDIPLHMVGGTDVGCCPDPLHSRVLFDVYSLVVYWENDLTLLLYSLRPAWFEICERWRLRWGGGPSSHYRVWLVILARVTLKQLAHWQNHVRRYFGCKWQLTIPFVIHIDKEHEILWPQGTGGSPAGVTPKQKGPKYDPLP